MNTVIKPLLKKSVTCLSLLVPVFLCSDASAQEAYTGQALYEEACLTCHGSTGRGGQNGPSILRRVDTESDSDLTAFLRTGSPERGMPPSAIADERLPELLVYLGTLVEAAPTTVMNIGDIVVSGRPIDSYTSIDEQTLLNPEPEDWLWFSRTADAQRFSPLDQINTDNVANLERAWSRPLPEGLSYGIPLVYQGIMYMVTPASTVMALDATNGDLLWEYKRAYESESTGMQGRSKTIALSGDMVYFTAPDSMVVALDAATGEMRWEAKAEERGHSSGIIAVKDMVISNGNCIFGSRSNCLVIAHDAQTGKERWRFNTVQAPGQMPGEDSWGEVPLEDRLASPWGLPGSYDPELNILYWSVANPMPTSRLERHGENRKSVSNTAPSDLYSNSTLAIDPDTGELLWYYQHLPGDDWDLDMNQERTLVRTQLNPDPEYVRWINPALDANETRDVVVNVGEGGGLWVLDAQTGEFLWATPFPFDVDNFFLSDIDVETGIVQINEALLVDDPGEHHLICYFNTRSFWPTSYNPENNSLYVPYIRNCLDMTSLNEATGEREIRDGAAEPGVPENELNGLAKVNLETGEMQHWPTGRIPTNSAILTTAGGIVLWGDIGNTYRAMHADTGEILWETQLSGPVSMSNITYSVDGRQYVAITAGETMSQDVVTGYMGPVQIELEDQNGRATLHVFALPE